MGTYLLILILLLLSAMFSGLNLGFMSLSPQELKRKIKFGNKQAEKIYSVRKDGNLLLVTLLLGNVAVNSGLSILLGDITIGLIALIVSTALITIFGEIIPQAVLSRHAIHIGSHLVWLVRVFIIILYPVCRPLSWVLNKALGEELPTIYTKKELLSILTEHSESHASDLMHHEERIATGALLLGDKKIGEVMTRAGQVNSFEVNTPIDQKLIDQIKEKGHTRYPVYENSSKNIVGILNVKDIIGVGLGQVVGDYIRKPVKFIKESQRLDKVLKTFLRGRSHLFVVRDNKGQMVGIVTIEDIIEEILQEEIVDEFDASF